MAALANAVRDAAAAGDLAAARVAHEALGRLLNEAGPSAVVDLRASLRPSRKSSCTAVPSKRARKHTTPSATTSRTTTTRKRRHSAVGNESPVNFELANCGQLCGIVTSTICPEKLGSSTDFGLRRTCAMAIIGRVKLTIHARVAKALERATTAAGRSFASHF